MRSLPTDRRVRTGWSSPSAPLACSSASRVSDHPRRRSRRRRRADTTGAGDAFVGAFAVGLAAGLGPVDAARLGCVAGSLSVRQARTQRSFPSRDEIEHEITINERGEP